MLDTIDILSNPIDIRASVDKIYRRRKAGDKERGAPELRRYIMKTLTNIAAAQNKKTL